MKKFLFLLIIVGAAAAVYWQYTSSSTMPTGAENRLNNPRRYVFASAIDHPSPQARAMFGSSISQINDVNGDNSPDLVIAASNHKLIKDTPHGQAFLLNGVDGSLIRPLELPLTRKNLVRGPYVSQIKDINGDGTQDILAAGKRTGSSKPGKVFLLNGSDGTVLTKIGPPTSLSKDQRATYVVTSVSQIQDLTGDGKEDIIVGNQFADVGGISDQGQVYLFSSADGSLIRTIQHPDPTPEARFGSSVSQIADLSGDGVEDILVGAMWQTLKGTQAQGRVYVVSSTDGSVIRKIEHPKPQEKAQFGASVSQITVAADGLQDVLVGASYQDDGENFKQGQVYVMDSTDGSLVRTLDHPKPRGGDFFGSAVSQVADRNGDGTADILVGADNRTVGGVVEGNQSQGQAYVFVSKPSEN